MLIPLKGMVPRVHESVFIADGARIIGDVQIGKESSVWFNTVIRGDVHFIRIGERTNVQDLCMLHVTHNKYPLVIGSNVTIGHGAILHGTTIHDTCLIGMGAKILDNSTVGPHAFVAAGSLVLEGFTVPEGTLVAGIPAKVKRDLTDAERVMLAQSAQNYIKYIQMYRT
jgi:gamma-carbonic anhydrase